MDNTEQEYIIEYERVTTQQGKTVRSFKTLEEAEVWATANNDLDPGEVVWDAEEIVDQRVTNVRLSARY